MAPARFACSLALLPGLALLLTPSAVTGAVIEVTAGGAVEDATYRFSDLSGSPLANFSATSSDRITASTDIETGSGNRVDDRASRLAAAEATIASLQATIASVQTALSAKLDATTAASTYQPLLGHRDANNNPVTFVDGGCAVNRDYGFITSKAVFLAMQGCGCSANVGSTHMCASG